VPAAHAELPIDLLVGRTKLTDKTVKYAISALQWYATRSQLISQGQEILIDNILEYLRFSGDVTSWK
jgi:hypothetical protein